MGEAPFFPKTSRMSRFETQAEQWLAEKSEAETVIMQGETVRAFCPA